MTFEQMQSVLGPGIKLKPKKSGEGSFFENFIDSPSPSSIAGVRAMYLRFFEHKIYEIEIFYEDKGKSVRLDEFMVRLSADLDIPAPLWKIKNSMATVDCAGFTIRADSPLNPRLLMTDTAAEAAFEKKLKDGKKSSKARS